MIQRPAFTIGIEEEYLLVDPETRDLVGDPGSDLMDECQRVLGSQVAPEFLKAQLEIGTKVSPDLPALRSDLLRLRGTLCEIAERHGYALIASSTHPFADWTDQEVTEADRYLMLAQDLQAVIRRLVICGMHVHVGIEDPETRIDLMNQVTYFLPHLLALSTSSPFWHGAETGLKSYRTTVFRAMPRTGLPEQFSSWAEYERHVSALQEAGAIEDATKLWWDVRPSAKYPTIEMRISDICTRVDDGLTIAALFQSILAMLFSRRSANQRWRSYADMLVSENIWRAQRYGVEAELIDFGRGTPVAYGELIDELIELVEDEAAELGCLEDVERARQIVAGGTSADRQLATYRSTVEGGQEPQEALVAVVDSLIEDTKRGL